MVRKYVDLNQELREYADYEFEPSYRYNNWSLLQPKKEGITWCSNQANIHQKEQNHHFDLSLLEISKLVTYEFLSNYVISKHGEKAKTSYMD